MEKEPTIFELNTSNENENTAEEQGLERCKKLQEELGVALSTKQKSGGTISLEKQAELANEMNLIAVQFDFRNRESGEIEHSLDALLEYREKHPQVNISIHGDTPKVDEANFEIRNKEKIRLQLSTAQSLASESYTVHPPAIKEDLFAKLPLESREKIIDSYADIFAEAIIRAIKDGSEFSVAVENMTAKGEEGAWGQKVDDILILIRKIEQKVAEKGVYSDAIKNHVGATLDIDHALRGATLDNFMQILESWFKGLGDYLKVVHLYGSSNADEKFIGKHKITLDFVSKFNPNARLFIESKQDPEITKELYTAAKEVV